MLETTQIEEVILQKKNKSMEICSWQIVESTTMLVPPHSQRGLSCLRSEDLAADKSRRKVRNVFWWDGVIHGAVHYRTDIICVQKCVS